MSRHLVIELELGLQLEFALLDSPLAELWLERFQAAQVYPLDNPDRFYGFGTAQQERDRALAYLNQCIDTINGHQKIIARKIDDLGDQDTLNYLHNIFERYHGLLDQQNSDYWNRAPDPVRRALAQLNLAVHRAETVNRGSRPRMVCTWFGLPKTRTLSRELIQQSGELYPRWGGLCLNYVEIGKTLLDLAIDDDKYISDDAFRPFNYYSADFVVRFYQPTVEEIDRNLSLAKDYFYRHQNFFQARGYNSHEDARLLPMFFPVADLVENRPRDQLINDIAQQQKIKKICLK